jgi:hypothetical protein
MRIVRYILGALLAGTLALGAASVDGQWKGELSAQKGRKGKRANKQAAAAQSPAAVTFDLKANGSDLTGTVTSAKGKRPRPLAITGGKIDGDKVSFTTVQRARKGERKIHWEGVVEGDKLTGTCTPEGGRRGNPLYRQPWIIRLVGVALPGRWRLRLLWCHNQDLSQSRQAECLPTNLQTADSVVAQAVSPAFPGFGSFRHGLLARNLLAWGGLIHSRGE